MQKFVSKLQPGEEYMGTGSVRQVKSERIPRDGRCCPAQGVGGQEEEVCEKAEEPWGCEDGEQGCQRDHRVAASSGKGFGARMEIYRGGESFRFQGASQADF